MELQSAPRNGLRLLALDGGGVRGLSSLMILKQLMSTVDPESPPKPCDYFDMIGGTSTGGLIAIMLGRLRMTVDECIEAYTSLSDKIFEKKSFPLSFRGKIQGRFDAARLERAIKEILKSRGFDEDMLLKDSPDAPCKVFVCATSKETSDTVCLTSYRSPRGGEHLLNSTKLWEACRATSAAASFFDPIAIGPFGEEFVDGGLGLNNPINALWSQAQDMWPHELQNKVKCVVSIGTGLPSVKPVGDDPVAIWDTLKELATETEKTAEQFRRDKSKLDDEGRYYRFNVDRGLEGIGLQESKKKKEIAAATGRYVTSQFVFKQVKACAGNLAGREYYGPYRTRFTLKGVPASDNFIERPDDTNEIEKYLIPKPQSRERRRIFVLHGLGGIGKTQLAVDFARRHQATFSSVFWLDGGSEERLKQSIAGCVSRIPEGQIPDGSKKRAMTGENDLDTIVEDVLAWLGRPDNTEWLLIFDNVDQDYEHDQGMTAYDPRRYLPANHGSVLITTRLARLAQLGESKRLGKADFAFGKAIFEKWHGGDLDNEGEAAYELLALLDGLPLALAQTASYLRETQIGIETYVRLYKQQWNDLMLSGGESDSPLIDYEHRSVGTTWTISFQMIESRSENAANILRLWAFLDNRDLWHGLLHGAFTNKEWFPEWLYLMACNEVQFLDACRLLLRYSLIEGQDSVRGGYSMHPVVHNWVLHMKRPTTQYFLRLAVMIVAYSAPGEDDKDYWVLQQRLLPHAEWVVGLVENVYEPRLAADNTKYAEARFLTCLNYLGRLLHSQRRLREAEMLFRLVSKGFEELGVDDMLMRIEIWWSFGLVYNSQGRLEEAEANLQQALEGLEKECGPDHPSTLATAFDLAATYYDQKRLEDAEVMFQRVLGYREKELGPYHDSTLDTVFRLVQVYERQGRLEEAEMILKCVMEVREKKYGLDHVSTLETVDHMGIIYLGQGRLEEAEVMFQRALQCMERHLGDDHQVTLRAVKSLGTVYDKQSRLEEAKKMYQRALEGFIKVYGPEYPEVCKLREWLDDVHAKSRRANTVSGSPVK